MDRMGISDSGGALENDDEAFNVAQNESFTRTVMARATAEYIEAMSIELGKMVRSHRLRHLNMFLWQVAYEAHTHCSKSALDKKTYDAIYYS
jgi:hypothetical protein